MKHLQSKPMIILASVCCWGAVTAGAHAQSTAQYPGQPIDEHVVHIVHTDGTSEKATAQWKSMYDRAGAKWLSGTMQWYFNPANVPSGLTADQVLAAMQKTTTKWSQMCNIQFQYMGTTSGSNNSNDFMNVWGFSAFDPSLSLYSGWTPTRVQANLDGSNAKVIEADMQLNIAKPWNDEALEGLLMHEIGHTIGIGHSDQPSSIMSATPYNYASYNRTLRTDDIAACTSLYGAAPNQASNRAMNWAESIYKVELRATDTYPISQAYDGYNYRYYPTTNAYVGTKGGRAYYMVGTTNPPQEVGDLNGFAVQVQAAGF